MSWTPHITVAAVLEREDRFLLVEERINGQWVFNQPAGHLEANESLIEAVIRETYEETGWRIQPLSLVGIYQWTTMSRNDTYVRLCFHGDLLEQVDTQAPDPGIEQIHWLSYDDILQRQSQLRSPLVLACINDYRAGRQCDLQSIRFIT